MRVTLADPSLARYAGQFVWLALDFDKPENEAFLRDHAVAYTPSFYVLEPARDRAVATQLGAMTLSEVVEFLERGRRAFAAGAPQAAGAADAALARGDQLLATEQLAEAAAAYDEAVRAGGASWPERDRALGSLTWSWMMLGQSQ